MIHILWHGIAACRFTTDVPGLWPEGHSWVALKDARDIIADREDYCRACVAKLRGNTHTGEDPAEARSRAFEWRGVEGGIKQDKARDAKRSALRRMAGNIAAGVFFADENPADVQRKALLCVEMAERIYDLVEERVK